MVGGGLTGHREPGAQVEVRDVHRWTHCRTVAREPHLDLNVRTDIISLTYMYTYMYM